MSRMFFRLFAIACVALSLPNCSSILQSKSSKPGVKYSSVYGPAKPSQTLTVSVTSEEFQESLGTGRGVLGARFVEVFRRGGGPLEWRIFDVQAGDPYALIGIREGDVLVAASDWVIFDPQRFRTYVELLRTGFEASILVRRDGVLTELRPQMQATGAGTT